MAGALAVGVGALGGVILAPHTTTNPLATILGATLGGLAAGTMTNEKERRWWWIPLLFVFIVAYALYGDRAVVQNGAAWSVVLFATFINWSALLLFALPTRRLVGNRLKSTDLKQLSTGLFLGTWIVAGLSHLSTATVVYFIINWPNENWLVFAPFAPIEHFIRALVGAVIGTGVIAGLRAAGLVKPRHARY